jgi:hypothetical protein
MEKLIPLISDIQEIIRKSDVNLEINLPMITVVGSQSTGIFAAQFREKLITRSNSGERFVTEGERHCDQKANLNPIVSNRG